MAHLLISRAHRFARPPEPQDSPSAWKYDRSIGAWLLAGSNRKLMVRSLASQPNPPEEPPPPDPPMSKKADLETGEDMKGE